MTRILVLCYARYGQLRALARTEANNARSVPGTDVDLRRVPETVPEAVRRNAGSAADDTPVAAPADLEAHDAILIGTPTLFGMMAGQMKSFLDQAGGHWAHIALVGKVAGVLASTGSKHGGHEATLLSSQIPLKPFGMLIVGMPHTFAGKTSSEAVLGGGPYCAGTIAGADGACRPEVADLAGARIHGAHIARIAARRTAGAALEAAAWRRFALSRLCASPPGPARRSSRTKRRHAARATVVPATKSSDRATAPEIPTRRPPMSRTKDILLTARAPAIWGSTYLVTTEALPRTIPSAWRPFAPCPPGCRFWPLHVACRPASGLAGASSSGV
ncbi:NAD(P)H:quinone oxidoreductase [Roseisalinus antarcticus]|uniref:p-benzoquinone reductase n=1 Tax=Roseisalinus antarcticus TaxID=254357 RepID=A0A1Y5T4T0_9RHOB|nr:p-benzoquinone reductase [Roseisalinus antarcticus]